MQQVTGFNRGAHFAFFPSAILNVWSDMTLSTARGTCIAGLQTSLQLSYSILSRKL